MAFEPYASEGTTSVAICQCLYRRYSVNKAVELSVSQGILPTPTFTEGWILDSKFQSSMAFWILKTVYINISS